jgi:hypothetical protein
MSIHTLPMYVIFVLDHRSEQEQVVRIRGVKDLQNTVFTYIYVYIYMCIYICIEKYSVYRLRYTCINMMMMMFIQTDYNEMCYNIHSILYMYIRKAYRPDPATDMSKRAEYVPVNCASSELTDLNIYIYIYIYIYICIYTHIYTFIHTHIYIYIYTYIYIYIYTYTYIYIRTCKLSLI